MPDPFVLGVDLDGVVGDHTAAFRAIVAPLLGVTEESLPLERSWDFHEWGFGAADYDRFHRIAVLERHMFANMGVIPGAADVLWRLSDAGVWIRIITHRLYVNWGHRTAVSDTVDWLDEHRIPYRDLCFLGAKLEVEADMYVDDAPHNVEQLRDAGNDVIVFDQPYNRAMEGPRAKDWDVLEELVIEAVARRDGALQRQLPGMDAGSERLSRRRGA